jgi:hypothetical protein
MDVREPRVRRRGFFLHSADTGEAEIGEHENAEGLNVRVRTARSTTPRQFSSVRRGRSEASFDEGRPEIRSGSVTGSRQRAHLPR